MSQDSDDGRPPQRPPAKRARLIDVAQLAGVDVSVVSRALNDDPNLVVAPATRERILVAAKKLHYRPNASARALRQAYTMSLGLLVPVVANFVYFELIRGIEQRAFEAGYVLLLANAQESDKAEEVYKRLVLERRVDGLLIASASDDDRIPFDFGGDTPPIVWVNRRSKAGPNVVEDDIQGMALAVQHLASLGHTQIGHIAGPQSLDTGRRRLQGFVDAMCGVGLEIAERFIVEGPFTEQGGTDCMDTLLRTNPMPTAVTVSSLLATVGALAGAKKAGLRIPQDLSIVAFHDGVIASYLDPPVTTIQMPLYELGRLAVDRLLYMMAGGELPLETVVPIPPRLIQRESTAAPANNQPRRKTRRQ
jgi:LacI family transcriptional regulator